MKKIFYLFISWRAFLFIPLVFSYFFGLSRSGYSYTLFSDYLQHEGVKNTILSFFLSSYANFDGIHYLTIAYQGYTINAGFFPLFPLLLSFLGHIFIYIIPVNIHIILFYTGLFMNTILFFIGLMFLYKLLKLDYSERTILYTIFIILFFPTSFYFAAVYSESLFFLLTILIFYFSRKKQWHIVAISACLLTATRLVGIAILPAVLYELYYQQKISVRLLFTEPIKNISLWLHSLYLSIVALLGIGLYSLFNYYKWKDFLFFIHAQGEFMNNRSVSSLVLFPQTVFRYIKILLTVPSTQFEWWIALLEFSLFFIVSLLLFLAWKKKIRTSYLIYAVVSFLIPISTGTFTGLPRYVVVLFPIFIALALSKNNILKITYVVISTILLVLLFSFFSRGYYIA